MNGRTGLNYLVLLAFLGKLNLTDIAYDAMLDDIQVMEFSALEEMNNKGDSP